MTERYKKIREFFLKMVDGLTTDQLNMVPEGFNNNIVWHLGHVVAAQQGVTYLKSGRELRVPQHIFDEFKSGSKPEKYYSAEEIEYIKSLFFLRLTHLRKIWIITILRITFRLPPDTV